MKGDAFPETPPHPKPLPIKGRGYFPVKLGFRFSMNAATPSR